MDYDYKKVQHQSYYKILCFHSKNGTAMNLYKFNFVHNYKTIGAFCNLCSIGCFHPGSFIILNKFVFYRFIAVSVDVRLFNDCNPF